MENTRQRIQPARKLGRKHMISFAYGIAHKFACSSEHYAWLAHRNHLPTVVIDLLTLRIDPKLFDIERNRVLAEMCHAALLRNMEMLTRENDVISASLVVHFGVDDYSKEGRLESIGKSVFTVILTDADGKQWRADHVEERMLVHA